MKKLRSTLFASLATGLCFLLTGCKYAILNPQGVIAADEKQLLIDATLLMLIIVIPVILLTFFVAWRYRASNTQATYSPEWTHSTLLEIVCWTVPCIIILILAILTWVSSHQLDPYKLLDKKNKTLVIEAIALNWKWLFIYPEQNIATVNFVEFPVNRPVEFLITADAPMNSFQIPQLGSQIYAMAGMQTKVNLMATSTGDFRGLSTNYSGEGFSDMKFVARATTQSEFDQWVKLVKGKPNKLTNHAYVQLTKNSEKNPIEFFSGSTKDLFSNVMMKYMMPMPDMDVASTEPTKSSPKKAKNEKHSCCPPGEMAKQASA